MNEGLATFSDPSSAISFVPRSLASAVGRGGLFLFGERVSHF